MAERSLVRRSPGQPNRPAGPTDRPASPTIPPVQPSRQFGHPDHPASPTYPAEPFGKRPANRANTSRCAALSSPSL